MRRKSGKKPVRNVTATTESIERGTEIKRVRSIGVTGSAVSCALQGKGVKKMPPRMRTFETGFAEIKATDPNTGLTKTALRRIVVSGAIPSVRIGTGSKPTYLFNLDDLYAYLNGAEKAEAAPVAGIRRVQV